MHLAATDDENRTVVGAFLGAQVSDNRGDEGRWQLVQHRLRGDIGRHPGGRDRCDRVGVDVVLGALQREGVDEPDESQLGGAVVGLSEVAEQTAGRGGDHDAAVTLLAEMRPCGAGDVVSAVQVNLLHRMPTVIGHLVESAVPQDAGVADHTVDGAELVDRGLDDVGGALFGRDTVVVGNRATPGRLDLVNHAIGHGGPGAGSVSGTAQVVDDHRGALAGEGERVLTAQASTGSGHDNYPVLHSRHAELLIHLALHWVAE